MSEAELQRWNDEQTKYLLKKAREEKTDFLTAIERHAKEYSEERKKL